MKRYNPSETEPKWQRVWAEQKTYKAHDDSKKPKYYALSFFPYPSGIGLHIGHVRNFTITDVAARFKRMLGHEVLHPMGWDSFGLPAENYAIKTGISPQEATKHNTDNFREQAKHLGLSIDWDREFGSTDPDYYKWTQWFFLLLQKRGLAYQKESMQFWCETDKTVLANEQVEAGKCWRCGNEVTKKSLKQWFFKITEYADQLADDLQDLDWPNSIKTMQRNWIGRSVGTEVDFKIDGSDQTIKVFTTRADTLFGATFMVLAPEHTNARSLATAEQKQAVEDYIRQAESKTDIDRMDQNREKTGVFTGSYAVNPVNGAKLPIWIADYVLGGYGTSAIMAVPAHDERDFAFAKKFNIEIKSVVLVSSLLLHNEMTDEEIRRAYDERNALIKNGEIPYENEGFLTNSGEYNDLPSAVAREKIVADLAAKGAGQEKINYKIRDWLISRQRYWGAPIPIIHCPKDGIVPVPEDQLPVVLPPMQDYLPTGDGRSPLAKNRDWVEVECPKCGGLAERETDTMDGFACSSWYALRFADPKNAHAPFSREKVEHWAPVDLYVGGAEHAVMHLLYARMWTKVMYDAGLISFNEPFKALRNQGMLLAEDGTKFSKSKGNGVDPEDVINNGYGADALRTTMMFLAPFDQKTPWSPEGLGGVYRFLNRVWTLAQEVQNAGDDDVQESAEIRRAVHKAIKKVTDDLHKLGFNTAIAALMELTNELYKLRATVPFAQHSSDWRWAVKAIAQMLAPFAPHLAEELWEQFGGQGSVHLSDWPAWDDAYLVQQTTKIVVQVNGKVRATIEVAVGTSDEAVRAAAFAEDHVKEYITGAPVKRVIVVPNKLINIVV